MKVGILTYHNAHNYGAVLQAYALKEKIRLMGAESEIINYRNEEIEKRYAKKIKNDRKGLHRIKRFFEIKKIQGDWGRQYDKFESFINKYLLEEKNQVFDIQKISNADYNVLIVGSDQVWASWITGGLDPVYLLDFNTSAKKVSYAASLSGEKIPADEKETFKRCLGVFDAISVREDSLKKLVVTECQKDAVTVLDPTLLVDVKCFEKLLPKERITDSKYVLAYFVQDDPQLLESAKIVADCLKVELIELQYYKKNKKNKNYIADAGPQEFLWYIKNAEFVVTNSFHGTVFSILFHKNYYSIYENDSRKDNLHKALGLENRHKTKICQEDIAVPIDYSEVDKRLCEYRIQSEKFLMNVLEEKA